MSAPQSLSTPQFGSIMDGTYDLAADQARWDAQSRPTRRESWGKIRQSHTDAIQSARDARSRGDRSGAARAMLRAAKARRVAETFGPTLKR